MTDDDGPRTPFERALEEVLYDFDGAGYLSPKKRAEYAVRLLASLQIEFARSYNDGRRDAIEEYT